MSIFYEIEFAKYILPYQADCSQGKQSALFSFYPVSHYAQIVKHTESIILLTLNSLRF